VADYRFLDVVSEQARRRGGLRRGERRGRREGKEGGRRVEYPQSLLIRLLKNEKFPFLVD
jgi:predicted transposase YdaD